MATLKQLLVQRSPESQKKIAARASEIRQEITLAKRRAALRLPGLRYVNQ